VGHLWYNKDLFEEAGVPLPPSSYDEAWTWDEFVEAAAALTDADKQQYGVGGIANADFVTSIARSQGATILSEDCTEFLMDDPVMVDTMQMVADLMQVEGIAADPETLEAFGGSGEMFNAGQLAMRYGDTRDVPADVDFEYDVTMLPVFEGHEPVIFAAIENYGVANTTEHPEEAAKFAAYLMSEDAQKILAETKNVIPINRAAAEEVWVNQSDVNRALLVEAAQYGRTNPFAVGFGRAQEIAWPAIQEVMLGQKTAEEAMAEVKPLVDAELQEIGGCLGQ
jgi:multiple sugar transport system substrate-binding protein